MVAPLVGSALISGASGLLGSAFNNRGARDAARQAQQQAMRELAFNRQTAKMQMDFQEKMSNTAYRRAAKDLQAAGLNRILALGSPATTPGGAGFSAPALGSMTASALAPLGQQGTVALTGASNTLNALTHTAKTVADIERTRAETKKTKQFTKTTSPGATIGGRADDALRAIYEIFDDVLPDIGRKLGSTLGEKSVTYPKKLSDIKKKIRDSVEELTTAPAPRRKWSPKDVK